ncbi:N-6 DNA methylase, partial [Patescibacteria group bacterium]|nr:N-6 DNA methylase [Patescibacteria group bacterium]MBU1922457.1 N-6 DNA methylase [Patescibacteria group bacterium]
MDKKQAKQKIKELIERYEKLSDKDINDLNEQQTKDRFIRPLFEALGWDFEQQDVWSEKDVQGQRADYAFMLNGITKFFVETKSLKVDLDLEVHARQAINYAWNKGVAWAVLTDFEGIKIFNALAHSKSLLDKLVFEISYKEYLSDFDRLWLLSREGFKTNALDEYAISYGKKLKKLTVNEKLFADLKIAREELTKGFATWNKKVDKETLDEGVQRILDRLVFIRVLEDRGLENPILPDVLREWENNKNEQLFRKLIHKFRELDDTYNSSLFKEHACEDWEEYSVKWDKIFSLLHGSQVYEYDFKEIPADILGGVYESYLSYIAQNPIEVDKKGESGRLLKIEDKKELKQKSRQKRKEQGIFYTPKFIVDYIVENTLGQKLKQIKGVNELKQIKILDPACGSGSFLTKALQTMNDKYKDFGNPGNQYTKSEILLGNIHGVDLDPQAVELAKLNLLIEALDQKAKLPDLTGNIRVGNSLISGTEEELKKYFGPTWRDQKPFNWEDEFEQVFKQGKFDVVIGNPPWVSLKGKQKSLDFSEEELRYFIESLNVDTYRPNLFEMFIWKSLSLLKKDGIFSFIVPDRLCANQQFTKLRDHILRNFDIKKIWFKVNFPGIIGDTIIFVIQKRKTDNNKIEIAEYPDRNFKNIDQESFLEREDRAFFCIPSDIYEIFNRINKKSKPLNSVISSSVGFIAKSGKIYKNRINKSQIEILKGENVIRYGRKGCFFFEFSKSNLAGGTQNKEKLGSKDKIFI